MGARTQTTNSNMNQNSSQSQIQSQDQKYGHNQYSRQGIQFAARSPEEQALLNQMSGLGQTQNAFLEGLVGGQTSPFALTPEDQARLDQSYQSAFDRFALEGKDYADYLATTRGLNKSDTPVSQQAMQRYGLGMADLLSQKANTGLNMGFQGTGMRLQGAGMAPIGLTNAFNAMYNERLAAPTTTQSGSQSGYSNASGTSQGWGNVNGVQNSKSVYNPSLMDNIGQGLGLGMQALQLGAGLGALGMGGMGGLGAAGAMKAGGGGLGAATTGKWGLDGEVWT